MKRRWIFWILVILFLWVVISRFSEIKKLAETLMEVSGSGWPLLSYPVSSTTLSIPPCTNLLS